MAMNESAAHKPLRLWPGVAAAALMLLLKFGAPLVSADGAMVAVLGALVAGLVIVVWWLFFSRAPWIERLGVLALLIVVTVAAQFLVHESIRGGMMGMMLPIYFGIPGLPLALVAALVLTRRSAPEVRRTAAAIAIVLAAASFTLLRTDGLMGGTAQITWRWTPTAEARLLAASRSEPGLAAPAAAAASPAAVSPAVAPETIPAAVAADVKTPATVIPTLPKMNVRWPGFRGADRDGIVHAPRLAAEWSTTPPVQLWRTPIGPGWSSFAAADDFIYTQEQRGDDEVVACYRLSTGKPVWMHKDAVRFYESNGGAGPRGTPTVAAGRIYTLGATGILNALEARTGAVVWSRNPATDHAVKTPGWGFSSSPLVVGEVVVVAVSGALAGYDSGTGAPRWYRKSDGGSYSSPHLVSIDNVTQILLMAGAGLASVSPADGKQLWTHAWSGVPIVQPAQIGGGDFLVTTADSMGAIGMRRIAVAHAAGSWTAEERWTSKGLKPYFNDFVIHKGHAYGFDGSILACIGLEDGARKWKGGRYGNGQFILLPDQDTLLVLSEEGEVALVAATPDQFTELSRFKAIEGKTWNHPVLIGDVLLVRNGEEMAAFRLPLAGR